MIRISEIKSEAFRKYVSKHPAPVILQVIPTLHSGGVEQGVIDMNAAITAAGGRSIVVSSGGPKVYDITRGGGQHIEMPVNSKNLLVMTSNIFALRRLIKREGVTLVHACSRAPAWSARQAVKGTGARLVTSVHAMHNFSNPVKKFYNASVTRGELVIAVSQFLATFLKDRYNTDPSVIRVIHRGVAVDKFHPNAVTPDRLINLAKKWRVPDGATVITLPARVTRSKGHMFLIDALLALGRDDIFCVFVGSAKDGPGYANDLAGYIERNGLTGKVRMVDHCDDMPAAYMLSTVVVCPSTEPEGFGRVAIEAQAMGRPVISTDHGGAQETIIPDETGWLVPPRDTAALTRALLEAVSLDPRERSLLATRAMAHVAAHFTVEKMCAETLDVYAELLASNPLRMLPPYSSDVPLKKAG